MSDKGGYRLDRSDVSTSTDIVYQELYRHHCYLYMQSRKDNTIELKWGIRPSDTSGGTSLGLESSEAHTRSETHVTA